MYVVFFFLWIVFNGKITLEIVLLGIIIAAVMYYFTWRFMGYSPGKEIKSFRKIGLGIEYILILFWEIVKANIHVIHFIVTSKYQIEPVIIRFKTDLKENGTKAVLANSITLTPGTITVSLEEDEYVIHCLDKEFAENIENSRLVYLLRNLEK